MKKFLLFLALFLNISPALADWTAKDAGSATITFSNPGACTSVVCVPVAQLVNAAGTTLLGTAGTSNAGVLTIQGIASMTKLLVTPDSVALPANQSVNLSQVNGVTTLTGTGAVGTGAARIAVGTDTATIAGSAPGTAGIASSNVMTVQGIASMTKLLVTPDSVALPANQSVNVAQMNGVTTTMGNGVSGTGVQRVAVASDNTPFAVKIDQTTPGTTNLVALAANQSTNIAQINGVTPLMGNGVTGTGSPRVTLVSDGTAISTTGYLSAKIDQTTIGTTNGVAIVASAINGASTTGNIAANNTTAVVIKASAGTLYGVQLAGIGSAPAYLKIYNATSATCGSGTPVKRLMIPAASTAANGGGSNITFGDVGIAFGTGITYCVTTGITDADTTAPAASTFLVNVDFK